jgi:hypothetical protein
MGIGAINDSGSVVGWCSYGGLGFVRTSDGTIITFQTPLGISVTPTGINKAGLITGSDEGRPAKVPHGFIGQVGGKFAGFEVSGAVQGTYPKGVNDAGTVAGSYGDSNGVSHGFVRTAGGAITTFDATGAGTADKQGTWPTGINTSGAITGYYVDASGLNHGFLRSPEGAITTFDALGPSGTFAYAINDAGVIAGYNSATGFVRAADGTVATFETPNAGSAGGRGTYALALNSHGEVSGYYWDANFVGHGFVRHPDGTIREITPRKANTTIFQGTAVNAGSINSSGDVAGVYTDSAGVVYGFVWTP